MSLLQSSCGPKSKLSENETDTYRINEIEFSDFQINRNLNGNKLNLKKLTYPRYVVALDDYIVIAESKADTMFHILTSNDFQYVKSIGKYGVGPLEVEGSSRLFKSSKKNSFWSNYVNSKTKSEYSIDSISILANRQIKPVNQEMYLASQIAFSSENSFLSTRNNGDDKYVEFSFDGEILSTYERWSDMLNITNYPINVISSLFQGKLAGNKSYSHFAYACLDADIVEILDKKSNTVTSIRGPIYHLPEFEVDFSAGYPMCQLNLRTIRYSYLDVNVTDSKVYALFSGHTYKEVDVEKKAGLKNQIFVFDFEGKPIANYMLDYPIISFSIDEKRNRIIAITDDEDPNVVVYRL